MHLWMSWQTNFKSPSGNLKASTCWLRFWFSWWKIPLVGSNVKKYFLYLCWLSYIDIDAFVWKQTKKKQHQRPEAPLMECHFWHFQQYLQPNQYLWRVQCHVYHQPYCHQHWVHLLTEKKLVSMFCFHSCQYHCSHHLQFLKSHFHINNVRIICCLCWIRHLCQGSLPQPLSTWTPHVGGAMNDGYETKPSWWTVFDRMFWRSAVFFLAQEDQYWLSSDVFDWGSLYTKISSTINTLNPNFPCQWSNE